MGEEPVQEEEQAAPGRVARAGSHPRRVKPEKEEGETPTQPRSDTQAKVAAARSRVAAARARKVSQNEATQEDLPAQVSTADEPQEPQENESPVLEMLVTRVTRLSEHSEETRQRLETLESRWSQLEEKVGPDNQRQTQLEIQLSHQSQELLDQRANLEALNRRLTEQHSSLQNDLQELLNRSAVAAPPVIVAAPVDTAVIEERDSWMSRCVELEAQQLEFIQLIDKKDAELGELLGKLQAQQRGGDTYQLELQLKDEELNSLRTSLTHRDHQVRDFEEALKSREEELSELSGLVEELESRNHTLDEHILQAKKDQLAAAKSGQERISQLEEELAAAQSQLSVQEQLNHRHEELSAKSEERLQAVTAQLADSQAELATLRDQSQTAKELATLQRSYNLLKSDYEELQQLHQDLREEHVSQTSGLNDERLQLERGMEQARLQLRSLSERYSKQVDATERLVRQLALNDTLLDEIEVVLDALPPPPPSLLIPMRRLRQKVSEIRANKQVLEGQDFKSYEGRIHDLQEELVQTRQKLLEAHSEIDALERSRSRSEKQMLELEKKVETLSGGRG